MAYGYDGDGLRTTRTATTSGPGGNTGTAQKYTWDTSNTGPAAGLDLMLTDSSTLKRPRFDAAAV